MDIHLNYKKEYQWNCLFYAIGLSCIAILLALTYCFHDFLRESYLSHSHFVLVRISFYVALEACASTTITVTFIIFMRNIYKRFSVLNSILRFLIFFHVYTYIKSMVGIFIASTFLKQNPIFE